MLYKTIRDIKKCYKDLDVIILGEKLFSELEAEKSILARNPEFNGLIVEFDYSKKYGTEKDVVGVIKMLCGELELISLCNDLNIN